MFTLSLKSNTPRFHSRIPAMLAALVMTVLLAGCFEGTETQTPSNAVEAKTSQSANDLESEGSLPENILGSPDAPVTIIEYSSMTCPHCAAFHTGTLPDLKKKYIDTGKVRYVIREFPLDDLAIAASMLARCVEPSKYFAFTEVIYEQQRRWSRSNDPLGELRSISKQAGLTEEKFTECLQNRTLEQNIRNVREHGGQKFLVNSTPTFIVNGQIMRGNNSLEEFEKVMAPFLENAKTN